ncbi:MAG: prepilin peptidase [Gammaproteobacteria bacterium]|nr:prepilin peptidase [Gammaproteobacteria bacterium]NNL49361.1 hypothetical protein [Woeseiaceae bacterium]
MSTREMLEMLVDEQLIAAINLSLILVVTLCAVTDIAENRIPNIVLFPALLLAFVCNSMLAGIAGFVECLLGLVLGMSMLFPFYFTGGTSAGDVKLLGVVGALLGAQGVFIAGAATLVFGGALGILFITWRVIKPKLLLYTTQLIRFGESTGPTLLVTATADVNRKTYFPYAPAIALGTYYSLWDLGYFSRLAL